MSKSILGRWYFGLLSAIIAILIPLRSVLSWNDINGEFVSPWARVANVYCYFTNQSAIIVGVVSLILALNLLRESKVRDVLQLTALVCTVVAGSVYYLLLASEDDLTGIFVVTNFVVHLVVPVMYALGWVLFIEHGKLTWKVVRLGLIFPVGWAIFALVRGAIIHYYPYPFMDVDFLGYSTALINMLFVTVFFILFYVAVYFLDTKLLVKRP